MWSCAMKFALRNKSKLGFIDGTCKSAELYVGQIYSRTAFDMWTDLKDTYNKVDGSVIFNLYKNINSLNQNGSSLSEYYHNLNTLWKQYDAMVSLPPCTCKASKHYENHANQIKLIQFLMGLDDVYQPIRSNILTREPLPLVKTAFAVISGEESHMNVTSMGITSKAPSTTAFAAKGFNNKNVVKRGNENNKNVVKKGPNPNLKFTNCNKVGHTVERCFDLIGYPPNYKKPGDQNANKYTVNNVVSDPTPSTAPVVSFSKEQMLKLLSLIDDKPISSSVANMASTFFNGSVKFNMNFEKYFNGKSNFISGNISVGWVVDSGANQHMTMSAKFLIIVVDVSNLGLTVGHPNGTKAKIAKIGDLKLNDFVTLFNVLVVPEYTVNLLSVHRLAKDSKFFVGFDENKLGHLADQVLQLLKDDLKFDHNNHSATPCDVCHKAKQTREPFPLSDHKSTQIGQLVHLDVWGPYKVTSKEGYKSFLTLVDDYSRAVWPNPKRPDDEGRMPFNNDGTESNPSIEGNDDYAATFIKDNAHPEGNTKSIIQSDESEGEINHSFENEEGVDLIVSLKILSRIGSSRVKFRERELHTTIISITSYPLKIQQLSHFIIDNHSFIMSTPVNTSSTDSQMHNNIMAAGSKDRPPMLGPGRYSQWRSRFLRYIDTKPNGGGLKKCILNGPYVPTSVLIQAVPEAEGRPAVQQHTAIETVLNMTPENKEHFQSEKEAIFLLLTGIGDEIYSTVDACNTANEMWIAIERLQQGESLNVQDVKTNLFWEFGKFTSRDGESMESYYSRFYKLMNELTRNNLQVTTMQVNVQFLQQLQPEWSRFVTIVKQAEKIDIVSYHRLFDILKQFQLEVNDIRAERIAKSANPLALLAAAQPYSDTYYQAPKPQRSNATSSSTRQSASTRHKGKESSPITLNLSLSVKKTDKTEDTYTRYNNDNQSRQFGNQRTMTVAGARETVGSQVVQQTGIQCFNCKGYGHYAKECRKPKRVKDYAYHKEKMMMCKQAEQGVPLQAEQADWLRDTDEEMMKQNRNWKQHYRYMAKIRRNLKKAHLKKPCLYEILFDTSDPANRFALYRKRPALENESRSN
ncbi:retrovirus-related pol polyprotein from transposon TNT 1-94 [Tanacetum coccineum]